jgi:uncharacterized membrane protein
MPVVAALVLLLAISAALRFWQLSREGLWFDELVMANLTSGPWSEVWRETLDARPPLYVMLSWLWTHVFGSSDAGIRSLSATLGVAAVAMTFVVGRQMFDTSTAFIAAVLMAVSPYQIHYSQEHRYYALVALLGLICLWMLIRGLRSGRSAWLVGFAVAGVLLHFAHYLNVFVFLAMGAAVLLTRRRWPHPVPWVFWFAIPVTLAVASAPMLNQLMGALHRTAVTEHGAANQVMWIKSPPLWSPIRTTANFLFLGFRYMQPIGVVVGLLIAAAGFAQVFWRRTRRPLQSTVVQCKILVHTRYPELLLLACVLILPMAASLAVSWVIEPMYVDRYMIASSPALYLLVAAIIMASKSLLSPAVATLSIVVVMLGSCWSYFTVPIRGDWRGAAAFLNAHLTPDDTLLYSSERGDDFETYQVGRAINWYLTTQPQGYELSVAQSPAELWSAIARHASQDGRTWVLVWDDPDRDRQVQEHLRNAPQSTFTLVETHEFYNLTIFELMAATGDNPLDF